MLITFKSKASSDIIMYEKHVQPLFDLIGKDIKRGVITPAECPDIIHLLEKQIDESKARESAQEKKPQDHDDQPVITPAPVSFAARFFPLLEMLKTAEKKQCDILWGV